MKKTFVLDTNVLLTDPNSLRIFKEHDVVLPLIVIEELDRHKDRSDEVGRNARETARILSNIMETNKDLKGGVTLNDFGGKLYVLSTEDVKKKDYNIPPELDPTAGDNIIVAFCKALQHTRSDLILVTRDLLLRLKGEALGIICEDYKKYNILDEKDQLYNGVINLKGDYDLNSFYSDKELDLRNNELSLYPNQFLVVENGDQSALMRYYSDGIARAIPDYAPSKISARNKEQKFAFDLLLDPKVQLVSLAGRAGGGKTLCALSAGLHQVLNTKKYKSLVVCRPVQPVGKDIGYLPGTVAEKLEPWIAPIKDNLRFLLSEDGKKSKQSEETLNMLFERGTIEIQAMTYIRGRSIANAFMIVEEVQNLSIHELKTILTRAGEGTKIVLTGDLDQIDNMYLDSISNGLAVAIEKFKGQDIYGHITLIKGERSLLATTASEIL